MFEQNNDFAYPDPFEIRQKPGNSPVMQLGNYYSTQQRPEMMNAPDSRFYQRTGKVGFCRRFRNIGMVQLTEALSRHFPVFENLVDYEELWSPKELRYRYTKFISWLTEDIMLHYDMTMPGYTPDDQDLELTLWFAPDTERATLDRASRVMETLSGGTADLSSIYYLSTSQFGGLVFKKYPVRPVDMDLGSHYNDDFMPIHEHMVDQLRTNGRSGLYLLHGVPGSGKTSYLRYLFGQVNKPKLYIPPGLATHLDSPSLMNEIREYPDSVLIIEDAECILNRRDANRDATLASVLNLSDGILGDCLNIQIVCTFNTSLLNIDPALMRKGRMVARYEFKPLETEKAQALAFASGANIEVTGPMTLAEIYHAASFGHHDAAGRKVGFGK